MSTSFATDEQYRESIPMPFNALFDSNINLWRTFDIYLSLVVVSHTISLLGREKLETEYRCVRAARGRPG